MKVKVHNHVQDGEAILNRQILHNSVKRKAMEDLFFAFILAIPRRLNFISQRFRTLCLFHLHRWIGKNLPAYEDGKKQCSETLAYKIQTPGNYSEESIKHSEHGQSLKSRTEDLSERPRRLILKELQIQDLDTLTYKNGQNNRRNIHKTHFSKLLPVPTNTEEANYS